MLAWRLQIDGRQYREPLRLCLIPQGYVAVGYLRSNFFDAHVAQGTEGAGFDTVNLSGGWVDPGRPGKLQRPIGIEDLIENRRELPRNVLETNSTEQFSLTVSSGKRVNIKLVA